VNGTSASKLPKMQGKSVPQIENILKKQSYTQTKVSNNAVKNNITWDFL
jgi:hypothetical protein